MCTFKKRQDLMSTLWVFLTLNYLYCDLIGLMDYNLLKQFLTGHVEGMEINQTFLLLAGILMEIPIAMVLLSKLLRGRTFYSAQIASASIKTLVMIATLFTPITSYYLFFATIEISTTLFIAIKNVLWMIEEKQTTK